MSKRPRKPKGQSSFGRPEDDPLQTFFMKKLRNCKLQVINAQSQAEIACFQLRDKNPNIYTTKRLRTDQDNYANQKIVMIKQWFKEIDAEHYELLYRSFQDGAEKWQFKEIHSKQDFPEYLFCDECDLSYVLFTALNSSIKELQGKCQFTQSQLLFFQLLCFAARDQIPFKVIQYFRQVYGQIITNMTSLKQKILNHYENSIKREREEQEQMQERGLQDANRNREMPFIFKNQEIPLDLRRGQLYRTLPKEDEELQISKNIKSRKIKKTQRGEQQEEDQNVQSFRRGSKKRGRPKRREIIETQNDMNSQRAEELLQKIITHIAWAYRYILPQQTRKKQSIEL